MSTFERVKQCILRDTEGVKEEEITEQAKIQDDLGLDSLDAVQVIMACEEEFGIEIGDDDMQRAETVADLVKLIDQKTAG